MWARYKLAIPKQSQFKVHRAVADAYTQLTEAGQDLFFDLAGHTRLLSAGVLWRVGIRVGREGAVLARGLVEPEALTDTVVQSPEPVAGFCVRRPGQRVEKILLHGQQQLGDHVPINRTQPLERNRTSCRFAL